MVKQTRSKKSKQSRSKTRSQKGGNGADAWRKEVSAVYKELKSKNAEATFGEALKEASKRRKNRK